MSQPIAPLRLDDDDDVADPRALAARGVEVLSLLRRNVRALVGGLALGATLGLAVAVLLRPEFRSVTRLLPYRQPGVGSGLSGLAGLAGVRLPAGLGEQTVTPELFPEVVRSLDFRVTVGATRIRVPSLDRSMTVVEYLRFVADSTWRGQLHGWTLGLPGKLMERLNGGGAAATKPVPGDTTAPPAYTLEYMKRLEELEERVIVSYDKKTSLVTIAAELPDAGAAAQLASVVSTNLMASIVRFETRKAAEQLAFLREQHARSRVRYEQAQDALAQFTDRNRGLTSATALVERARLEREASLTFEVFGELSRQLEQVALKVKQDTPAFTVLEQPVVPPKKFAPKRAVLVLMGAIAGLALAAGLLVVRWWMSRA